jgi:hypothetical protein
MTDNTPDTLKAARQAFEAYEKAVEAAQEFIAGGPPRGLRTCVMTKESEWASYYKCSDCGESGTTTRNSFCGMCGAEIVRFATEPASNTITVGVETVKPETRPVKIRVETVEREYRIPRYTTVAVTPAPQTPAPKAQRRKRAS